MCCFTSSCKDKNLDKQRKIDEKIRKNDSINFLVEEKIKGFRDSIKIVRQNIKDSMTIVSQNIIIADIPFGVSKKEGKAKIADFIKKSGQTIYPDSDLKYPFIGKYEFSSVNDFYDKDRLYMIQIRGKHLSMEEYIKEVPKQIGYVSDAIRLKYGKADINESKSGLFEIKEGNGYLIKSWTVGTKKIEIRLKDQGNYHTVDVHIFQPVTLKKINADYNESQNLKFEKNKDIF